MINKIISAGAVVIAVGVGIYGYLQDVEVNQKMLKFINTGPRYTAQDGVVDRQERRQADQELCKRIAKLERSISGIFPFNDFSQSCNYDVLPTSEDLKVEK